MNGSESRRVVVTGAARGIGASLVERLLDHGDEVHATCRPTSDRAHLDALAQAMPDRLHIHVVDVTVERGVADLARALADRVDAVDLLINNAGVMTDGDTIRTLDPAALRRDHETNAIAPAVVTQALLPLLTRADQPIVANMSSSFASLELKSAQMPPRYAYSMSKAALNMLTKTLALELAGDGVTVVAIHPGWVRTGIGGPDAALSPAASAAAVVDTIGALDATSTGAFLTWDGRPLPW
ncbi:MAG: SDR family oxidoreductase [Actinomycetota bacterium]